MGERSSYTPGTFCWVELSTTDPDAAKAFYGGLFGWECEDMPVGDEGVYTMLRIDGRDVAALQLQQPGQSDAGIPPNWFSYISTDDVDAATRRVSDAGGTIHMQPFDVMDAGRMSVVQDPTGAVVGLWQAGRHFGAALVNEPGALSFNQLNTSDPEAAARFYSDALGWTVESVDTGAGPPYWSIENQGALNGGVMELPSDSPAPSHWLVYFATDDLDATVARIGELGGEVLVEPVKVPAGRFAVARDPQGAAFALFDGDLDP
jgi:predicted enzyme related to lactoylglutathione lyase